MKTSYVAKMKFVDALVDEEKGKAALGDIVAMLRPVPLLAEPASQLEHLEVFSKPIADVDTHSLARALEHAKLAAHSQKSSLI